MRENRDEDVELRERREVLPQITDNALEVLKQRYFLKDAVNHPTEDVEQFFRRVVRGVIGCGALAEGRAGGGGGGAGGAAARAPAGRTGRS